MSHPFVSEPAMLPLQPRQVEWEFFWWIALGVTLFGEYF